ncbi:MAG: RagB/SusD family nutrient uptake outer membrane protein [Cyclobacteriaceae bacterium]|nr:RagB/SusD family nutrient uptake outer membrane protein [Cyclobacteriaceae bacterium HetDA_MAG_MS6]
MVIGCTDLEVEEKDSVLIEDASGEFTGVDPLVGINNGYQDMNFAWGEQARMYALAEHPSDELMGPTRGTDWGDNGVWRTLAQHTWSPDHLYIRNSWNDLNQRVFNLNQVLHPASNANDLQIAEGRFLRAWHMYWILDFFGQIPFRDADDPVDEDPVVLTAQQAYDFIMADIDAAIPNLPSSGPGKANTEVASQAAARFLKAKMLLNKAVFLGGEHAAADMTEVISLVDAINGDGFELDGPYFDIFTGKDATNTEPIFWIDASVGNRMWSGLHYNQVTRTNTGGGWNGFTTTAEFYDSFEGDPDINVPGSGQEERRGYVTTDGSDFGIGYGFLIGQQYDSTGAALNDRPGNPLVFTKELPGLAGNNERTGIRMIKYHPVNGDFNGYQILFRYADAHLMKAEAILRGGTGSSESALDLVNELRALRDAEARTAVDLTELLAERGRELYIEGWRRNDQIRFGTFTSTWTFKDVVEDFRKLFPIPDQALATNPNLQQNPGY